jgi:hypothetical protein
MNHCTVLDPYPRIVKIKIDNMMLDPDFSFGIWLGMHESLISSIPER